MVYDRDQRPRDPAATRRHHHDDGAHEEPPAHHDVIALQRLAGNAAVSRMFDGEEESSVPNVVSSGGRPLPTDTRAEMEARLGADFSDVRIHTDAAADESARSMQAHAYTAGSHIAFRDGAFSPTSDAGRTTLAHELTHVMQQRSGPVAGSPIGGGISVSDPDDRFERQAAATAEQAMQRQLTGDSPQSPDQSEPVLEEEVTPSLAQRTVQRSHEIVAQRDADDDTFDHDADPLAHPPVIKPADDSIGELIFELRAQEDQEAPTPLSRPTTSLDTSAENLRQVSTFSQSVLVQYGSKSGEPDDAAKSGLLDSLKQSLKDFAYGGETTRSIAKTASANQRSVDNATVLASLVRSSFLNWIGMVDQSNSAWGLTKVQAKECQIDISPGELGTDDPRRLIGLGGAPVPEGPDRIDVNQVQQSAHQVAADVRQTGTRQAIDNTSFQMATRNHLEKSTNARIAQRNASQILFEGASAANAGMLKAEDEHKADWQAYRLALDSVLTAVEIGGNIAEPLSEKAAPDTSLTDWGVDAMRFAMDEKLASIERTLAKLKECQANRQAVISDQQAIATVEAYQLALKSEREALITLDEEGQKMMSALKEFGGVLDQSVEDKGLMPKGFSTNEADLALLGRIRQSLATTELAARTSPAQFIDELQANLAPLADMSDGPWPALFSSESARYGQISTVVNEAQRLLQNRKIHLDALHVAFLSGMKGAGDVGKPY
ncbi:DUF4157 domain-containing protein [Actinopolymorpha pittospori]|uniref:eCIS core domain-containing protein n=1 Tax=Actinopolymorpha pittospori TaxID=648752 RepID=A0A927NBA7_9ACTN|nr:DUF4157 domain-containing protein [Actinopolymorpha pittospori]MBE1611680.1 hypothetical protein [Actinopolymorpha pittospori]